MERLRSAVFGGAIGLGSLAAGNSVQAEDLRPATYEISVTGHQENASPETSEDSQREETDLPLTDTQITILTWSVLGAGAIYLGRSFYNDLKSIQRSRDKYSGTK